MTKHELMKRAIEEAREGIRAGHGGPFGTVIVKDGQIVGRGHNCVLRDHDATCHGEVAAIRDAGRHLGTYDLTGCELYTTGEPCHMCLCACMWANIRKIYYGCTIADNGRIASATISLTASLGDVRSSATTWRNWIARNVFSSLTSI